MGKSWIQTWTGRKFWPLAPRVEDVSGADIAHALGNICRFTGHSDGFYSVSQHSVGVSRLVSSHGPRLALIGLLHDASEAYMADIASPIKHAGEFGTYRAAEKILQDCIFEAFRCVPTVAEHDLVSEADKRMLAAEVRDLMTPLQPGWGLEKLPDPSIVPPIIPLEPVRAQSQFIRELDKLLDLYKRKG